MKRFARSKAHIDPTRRRAVDAAIRHAEKVVQSSGVTAPVLYRPPNAKTPQSQSMNGGRSVDTPKAMPDNLTMEMALREALGLPIRATPTQSGRPTSGKSDNAVPARAPQATVKTSAAERTKTVLPAFVMNTPRATPPLKTKKKKTSSSGPVVGAKKTKANKKAKTVVVVVRKPLAPGPDRRAGAAANAASRLAINVRIREASEIGATRPSPFLELQRCWQAAFVYLQRFEEGNPDAPDVLSARLRLAEVEAEWERLESLAPDHPEYFPWPSTKASGGDGSIVVSEWQEIGMLAYLGYHVGLTSTLTAAQRAALLGRVFVMRLPPLNGLAYMRQWGAPDTGARLHRIAESLAAFARNAKRRRNPNLAEAIRQWQDDLSYLQRSFYVDRFDFPWPAP